MGTCYTVMPYAKYLYSGFVGLKKISIFFILVDRLRQWNNFGSPSPMEESLQVGKVVFNKKIF
jgi:hypothetical protein